MCKYNTVLFDLDGTLTDPALGITNSAAYALKKWGIEVSDRTELYKFIGPPLLDSFKNYYGFTREDSERAVEYFREYFSTKGMFENSVYEGIRQVLSELRKSGKRLIVATSKAEIFAKKILEHFELSGYFDFVSGATLDSSRVEKADVIQYALDCCGITDVARVVMIGDREYDVFGAAHFGIDSVGVLYGYGSKEELTAAGATYIAQTPLDILNIVK